MTLAAQLAESICGTSSTPGIVHDPLSPLVLGDTATGAFSVLSFDPAQKRLVIQVVNDSELAIYTFDAAGNVLYNEGNLIGQDQLDQAVADAQAAAAASALSAQQAGNSAAEANNAIETAAEAADDASASATLSQQYASAPETIELPGGGVSSAVSASRANEIARISRELTIGDNVSASETYQVGFLYTERPVIVTTPVVITIPPGIFTSSNKRKAWSTYRLKAASGSVKVEASGGTSTVIVPSVVAFNRGIYREPSSTNSFPRLVSTTVNLAAGLNSPKLVVMYTAIHGGSPPATVNTQAVPSIPGISSGWGSVFPYPAHPTFGNVPEFGVFSLDMAGRTAGNYTITISGGDNIRCHIVGAFIINNAGPITRAIGTPINATQTSYGTTLAGVPAQSRVLGLSVQRGISSEITFTGFGTALTTIAGVGSGNTTDQDDQTVSDTDRSKNLIYGFGQGSPSASGSFSAAGNFSAAVGVGGAALVSIDPITGSGGGVVLELEDGRDTLTTPNGVMELWFLNDGLTVQVRTPKP